MKIKMMANWENEIKFKVTFTDGTYIVREVHRYVYAIHCHSVKVIPLKTKSLWLGDGS